MNTNELLFIYSVPIVVNSIKKVYYTAKNVRK